MSHRHSVGLYAIENKTKEEKKKKKDLVLHCIESSPHFGQ